MSAAVQGPQLAAPFPSRPLPSTTGETVDLAAEHGTSVLFVYPRTSPPEGASEAWQMIPGAPGCTAESCSFRDLANEFAQLKTRIFGVSTQQPADQLEASERLHLGYPLLSDPALSLAEPLGLETFDVGGARLYRRVTLIVDDGSVIHRFDDIREPGAHPHEVLDWLERQRG